MIRRLVIALFTAATLIAGGAAAVAPAGAVVTEQPGYVYHG